MAVEEDIRRPEAPLSSTLIIQTTISSIRASKTNLNDPSDSTNLPHNNLANMQFTTILAALAATTISTILAGPMPEPIPNAALMAARAVESPGAAPVMKREENAAADANNDEIFPFGNGDVNINAGGGGIWNNNGNNNNNNNNNRWGWNNGVGWNNKWGNNGWNNNCGSVSCWTLGCNAYWWGGQQRCSGGWSANCPCW